MSHPVSDEVLSARDFAKALGYLLALREHPSSREIAEAENFMVGVAGHTCDALARYVSDDRADVAAQLRELLPETMDADFREKARQVGIASSVLYRFRNGSVPPPENLERIADLHGRSDLVTEPDIPKDEIQGDVMRAAYDLFHRGKRELDRRKRKAILELAGAAAAWYADPGGEWFDLPYEVRELALGHLRARHKTAQEEARAKRVTPAAIRKRRSRRSRRLV
jgi:hypothetical protein